MRSKFNLLQPLLYMFKRLSGDRVYVLNRTLEVLKDNNHVETLETKLWIDIKNLNMENLTTSGNNT